MMETRQANYLRKNTGRAIFLDVTCMPVAAKPWVSS